MKSISFSDNNTSKTCIFIIIHIPTYDFLVLDILSEKMGFWFPINNMLLGFWPSYIFFKSD